MALAPNTGYGMLNPGTTTPPPPTTNPFLIGAATGAAAGSQIGPTVRPGGTQTNTVSSIRSRLLPPVPHAATYTAPAVNTSLGLTPYSGPSGAYDPTTDPGYQAQLALQQQGMSQLDAQLKAAREQAIINLGDPNLAQEAGFGLDPQAAAFAQQNYLSGNAILARLAHQHDLNSQAVVNQLAAHGILNSGDYGYREGEENRGYGNNVYDARQAALEQLSTLYSNYLNSRMGLQQNVLNALLDAANRAPNDAQNNPPPPPVIPPPSSGILRTTYSQPRKGVKAISGPSIFAFK